MKSDLRSFLLFSTGLLLGSAALAAPPAPVPALAAPAPASCDVTMTTADDGSVKLSNSADPRCDVPAAASAPVPAGASGEVANGSPDEMVKSTRASGRPFQNIPVAASADAASGQPAPQKDAREQYRDIMMQGNQGTTASNPAVSRRYKAMDKATYQATVLGGVAPGSQ